MRFHLTSGDKKTLLVLSMNIRCWDELVRYGTMAILKREYGVLVLDQPEQDYNVSLLIDLEQVPQNAGE